MQATLSAKLSSLNVLENTVSHHVTYRFPNAIAIARKQINKIESILQYRDQTCFSIH